MRNWLAVGVVGIVSTLGVVSGLGAGGCSSSAAPATVSSYCQQVAQTECPPIVALCSGLNEAACEASVESTCNANASAAESAGRTFQSGNVGACISALGSVYNTLSVTAVPPVSAITWTELNGTCGTAAPCPNSVNDTCERVFQGTTANNVSCKSTYDCLPNSICGSAGACGPETDKQMGQPCSDPGDLCASGTVCSQQPGQAAFVCTAGVQVGGSCSTDAPCSTTAQCIKGKCVQLAEAGGECSTDATSSNPACDPTSTTGDYCDTSGSKSICTYGLTFGNGGADCKSFGG